MQLSVVPHYTNITVTGGLKTSAWDSRCGWILVFRANGSVSVAETGTNSVFSNFWVLEALLDLYPIKTMSLVMWVNQEKLVTLQFGSQQLLDLEEEVEMVKEVVMGEHIALWVLLHNEEDVTMQQQELQ